MSLGNNPYVVSKTAGGSTIAPFVAVIQSSSADNEVTVAGANAVAIGIAPEYSTAAGEHLPVYIGGIVFAKYGGSVTRGQKLKTDSSGYLVPIATTGTVFQNVIAIAAESGSSGEVRPVQVQPLTGGFVALS